MKKTNLLAIAVVTLILLLGANPATALDPIPKESGFSGFIRPSVGYLNYKSNMVASFLGYDLSDKKTNSLNDDPDSQSNVLVTAPFSLQYTFASTRTQIFLGTDLTDLIRFDYSQQFGVKQEIGRLGLLQGGILFSGIPAKVWRDPYVVDKNRDDTSRTSNGVRIAWDRIFGSQLQLQYTYRKIEVNNESSGNFLGLTRAEKNLLERDGDRHIGEVVYRLRIGKKHTLNPAFIYSYNDRDGDAMKNDAYDLQLTYGYRGDTFTFTGNASIGQADYDDRNPIYDKKQDDDRYGVQGSLYYKNPWDWGLFGSNPMNFFVSAAFVETNSNIDFYDQEAIMVSGGVFFNW